MIVVLKHFKQGNMVYVSHIDLLRHFTRAFRRAGLEIEFSEGFNPHMLINLGTPLPLGMNSSAEYLTVRANVRSAEEFMEKYNAVAPEGLQAIQAFAPLVNPNLAGRVVAADYSVKAEGAIEKRKEIEGVQNLLSIEMPVTRKGETKIKEVAPLVNGIRVYPDAVNVCLAAGNTTLRADAFLSFLAEKIGFTAHVEDLWKYEQYVRVDGALTPTDEYLKKLESGLPAKE